MNHTISLILDVVCYETSERYRSDLGDMSQVSFYVFFEHRGSVTFELGIVQVKLHFHGGTREKERVKKPVSQVTECCFHWCYVYCVF